MNRLAQAHLEAAESALMAAAEEFDNGRWRDRQRALLAEQMAHDVRAMDEALQDRAYGHLASHDRSGDKPEALAARMGISTALVYRVLEQLRQRGLARQRGGWWRRCEP